MRYLGLMIVVSALVWSGKVWSDIPPIKPKPKSKVKGQKSKAERRPVKDRRGVRKHAQPKDRRGVRKHARLGTLVIQMTGFKPIKGHVMLALYRSKKGFPNKNKSAYRQLMQVVKGKRVVIKVRNVPYGEYAVSAFHDVNSNKKLDTGLFGIPKEAYGASNNARRLMGPPEYSKAKFKFTKNKQTIQFHLK